MSIQAVIFDVGGVLLRVQDRRSRRKWEAALGLQEGELFKSVVASDISTQAMVGAVPEEAVWDYAASTYGLDSEQTQEFQRDFWAGDQLNVALVRFIDDLRPKYRTAILSNAWSNARADFNDRFALHSLVDLMIISAEEGVAKPDPRIYQLALARLDVQPQASVFIDDLEENVIAAQVVGMYGVRFESNAQTMAQVREILGDASSLPKA